MAKIAIACVFLLLGCDDAVHGRCPDTNAVCIPDAKPYMDAAPDAPGCSVPDLLGALTLGSSMTPIEGDWFDTPTAGTNAGKKELLMVRDLPTMGSPAGSVDTLFVEVFENSAFNINAPYAFTTDATAMTYEAAAYIAGDYDRTAQTLASLYCPSEGTITFTEIGDSDGSLITGSTTLTMLHEVDTATGVAVPGGCTTSFTLTFNLKQKAAM